LDDEEWGEKIMGSRQPFQMHRGLAALICVILLASSLAMAEPCEKWVAKVVSAQGKVQALRQGENQWAPVKFHDLLCPGDRIRVLAQSRADLLLANESTLRLDQNTTVTFSLPEAEKTSVIEALKGAIHFFSRHRRNLKVVTPFVNATVEGTEFYITVEADRAFLSVFEGQVIASNQAGEIALSRGQSARVVGDQAPALHAVVRPREAIQWTLYYLPVLDYRPSDFQAASPGTWHALVQRSIEFYREGTLDKALETVSEIVEEIEDARFYTYRASLLLSVGRAEEAKSDMGKALQLNPMNSHALSLQSVIAVVQNEKEKALDIARRAVEADPESASARIALSYALQAKFDLEGALASLKESIRIDPENGLAWARLSELHLSFGNLKEAFQSADKAVTLNPRLARTHTVLGYAHLAQIKIKKSKEAFEKAIALDQADPLPRLGLGLAKIREGDLKEGRGEIEIAASLDPDHSLIRSYLGKAYYEEKRDKMAANQYAMAKDLDPSDPTPFFYDAIRKQTQNRPVEALEEMQASIALNNHRAVYRSRLLLDEDLAARSASFARIYSDLGFQPLALVEGWKSLNTDPGNFSAHRFLSDSYSALPRHEIARVSELLQSQLLQPINITPLQPHLAQSNLFVLTGAGPSEPSFNEFNPLFNRNRITLQASGIAGGNRTFGEEAVLAGIWDRVSYSIGQFHYQTEGFRENNDLKDDLYNAFLQISLAPQTSLQGEVWAKETEFGDLRLRFFPTDILWNRQNEETRGIRLGFHHAFSPGSELIGSLIYQDVDYVNRTFILGVYGLDGNESSCSGEIQYLFRSQALNLVAGVGHFEVDRNENSTFILVGPPPTPIPLSRDEMDIHHTNLYLYSYLNYLKKVTLTVGASADFFKGGVIDRKQFNPKLGITWNPFVSTTLRAALFRTFRRPLINNQTIEPTQVSGFNQFFDDENMEGTDAWRYGVALDQKFFKGLFGGAEYSGRFLKVPYIDQSLSANTVVIRKTDWEERMARAYLFWTPHPWFGLGAEYQYERLDRGKDFVFGTAYASTHRFPLGVSFYHPSGLSALLKATYFDQKGVFQHAYYDLSNPFFTAEDRFWIFDTAVSYRLPNRLGFLTLGAKNLFNKDFRYQDTDTKNPMIQPKRFLYGKATLAF
jgi:tetratricopeptide (TPR) repeat protein